MKSFILLFAILFSSLSWSQDYLAYEHDQGYPAYEDEDEDDDEENLPYVEIEVIKDLQALGQLAQKQRKVIFVEMSASYCGYCKTLEEHIIKPMLRSGDYTDHVLIRKLDIDSHYPMKDFNGDKISPAQFSYQRDVSLTPTLLFLDGRGEEISERILGVNTLEMYGAYVDEALEQGRKKLGAVNTN